MHPLSKAMYDVREDGLLDIVSSDGTRSVVFTYKGERVEGNLYNVDIHMCHWLAGPQLPAGAAGNPKDFPTKESNS